MPNDNEPHITRPSKLTDNRSIVETYLNEEYGFKFEYPNSWKLKNEMKDIGREALEGNIILSSKSGTIVTFNANQGGKGGDCVDDQADFQRTTKYCHTKNIIKLESFSSGIPGKILYYHESKITPPTMSGGPSYYRVGLMDNKYSTPVEGDEFTPLDIDSIVTDGGLVEISISGNDDLKNTSIDYFQSSEVKEAHQILVSFRLIR